MISLGDSLFGSLTNIGKKEVIKVIIEEQFDLLLKFICLKAYCIEKNNKISTIENQH